MAEMVDLFAGLGGFSEGAEQAGHEVVAAANHWPLAVYYHFENHPRTKHFTQDLQQADWRLFPFHDALLASPACQGHSNARGREKPHHDASRSTAWAVIACAEHHRPDVIIIENVQEFAKKWDLYPIFIAALERLNYAISVNFIDAADCGVPQNRVRTIIICTKSRTPFELKIRKRPHVPASSFIDLDGGAWSPVRTKRRSQATLARVKAGREAFGDTFLMPYYSEGSGLTGRSLDRPIGTIPTMDRWAIVRGSQMRMLTVDEYRAAMSFPKSYKLPYHNRRNAIHLLGNAVPPKMAKVIINAVMAA